MDTVRNYHEEILKYRKDRHNILYHPVMVTDEGVRLMITVIDLLEASMRRFINYELPDCMAREEMKTLLDGPRVPGPDKNDELRVNNDELRYNADETLDDFIEHYSSDKRNDECIGVIKKLRSDNARLLTMVDEAIAWHEGDDSPHAQLEHKIAQLQKAVDEARVIFDVIDTCKPSPVIDIEVKNWLAANPKESDE